MKTIVALALLTLSTVLRAQVGATADAISVPEFGGAKVLHHCTVIEVQTSGVKVCHDDGVSTVAAQFLPETFQKVVQAHRNAEIAALKKEFADVYKMEQKVAAEPIGADTPFATSGESTYTASGDQGSVVVAGVSGSAKANDEATLMAHRSHSKTTNNQAAVSVIPGPVVHRASPGLRIIRFVPIPYYVPWPVRSVTVPQFTTPTYTFPYEWDHNKR